MIKFLLILGICILCVLFGFLLAVIGMTNIEITSVRMGKIKLDNKWYKLTEIKDFDENDRIKLSKIENEQHCEDCAIYDKCQGIMQYGTKCFRPKESVSDEKTKEIKK